MPNSPETIEIEKVVDGGLGLARIARGVTLVPGTLPNETVAAHLSEVKSGVARGNLASVITPNPARAAPACPLFLACGGCDFLHTSYSYELELKQIILAETLERIGKIKPPILPPVPSPSPEFYRTFVQLKIDDRGRIGLFRRDTHEVVPFEADGFEGCRIQGRRLNDAVAKLQGKLAGFQVIKFRAGSAPPAPHVPAAPAPAGHVGFVVNITSEKKIDPDAGLQNLMHDIGATGFLVNDRLIFGDPGALYIYGEAPGPHFRFRVSFDAFFQADPTVVQRLAERMADVILRERGPNRLRENMLDLYAGVGTFGIWLASKVLGVYCVEIGDIASQDMAFNMAENRVTNLGISRSTVTSFLKRFRGKAGIALIDPPRAGMDPEVRKAIVKLSPPLILYVSCHPSTLARDLADLRAAGGYEIDSVQIFDQFGRTHHIESLAILRRV